MSATSRLLMLAALAGLAFVPSGWSDDPARAVKADDLPPGWSARSPRDEIRPAFAYDPAGGPKRSGAFVITHDSRAGLQGWVEKEFPGGTDILEGDSRRNILKLMAASFGLAGMAACSRPVEKVVSGIGGGQCAARDSTWVKLNREVPDEIVVSIWINPDLACLAPAAGRISILTPHRKGVLAVVSSVRVDAGKHKDFEPLDDRLNLIGSESGAAVNQTGIQGVGFEKIGSEVDHDVRTTPLARVRSADEENARLRATLATSDPQCMTLPAFGGEVWESDELGESWVS